jgi:hypothetical protein
MNPGLTQAPVLRSTSPGRSSLSVPEAPRPQDYHDTKILSVPYLTFAENFFDRFRSPSYADLRERSD